jgi:hypothetical protein
MSLAASIVLFLGIVAICVVLAEVIDRMIRLYKEAKR